MSFETTRAGAHVIVGFVEYLFHPGEGDVV
jgi:hypothetical protein